MREVAPVVRVPFVHRARPEVYPRLLGALAQDPLLLARMGEARRELAAAVHPLQALSRHAPAAESARTILGGTFLPQGGADALARALGPLRAVEPYEHFLREVGTSLKAPLVRPKAKELQLLNDLADLAIRHLDLFAPAATWLLAAASFVAGGCRLGDQGVFLSAPFLGRFFASPLRATEEEEYGDAAGDVDTWRRGGGVQRVVVYLVTVGPGWDNVAGEYARDRRPYMALLANALGAGAADTVAKDLNDFLDDELLGGDPDRKLRRCSPGYGDWPLSDQRILVSLLNPEATLGVTLNEGDILIPEKSTSGLMAEKRRGQGIGDRG